MDWKIFWTTFGLVFLAELGDKTQLATVGFSAAGNHRGSVFAGASAALVLASFLAVVVGAAADAWLPRSWIRVGAGAFFIGAGVVLLLHRG